jgi:hypothetical protein
MRWTKVSRRPKKLLRDSSGFDSLVVAKTTRSYLMAWTEITRPKYQRDGLRYASDTTDEEWALIEPHLPPPVSCGRTRETSMREVVNAVFYIVQTGCQWRLLPKNFPPYTTVKRCSGISTLGATAAFGRPSIMCC